VTNPTVEALTRELQELEAQRPEMPRGLHAEHPKFIEWHQAFQAHVDRKQQLLSRITAHLYPIETGVRQERPIPAEFNSHPVRLRR